MALFGLGGYNEKTYVKNTQIYTDRLNEMMVKSMGYGYVGKILNKAIMALSDGSAFPQNANKKDVEAIDARIERLIAQFYDDLQHKSQAKLEARANMIASAIADSRNFGKEVSTPQILAAEENMAEARAKINDYLQQKDDIQQKMDEIYRKCQKVDENSSEFERLEFAYGDLEGQLNQISGNLQLFKNQYEECRNILNLFHDQEVYGELDKIDTMKPGDFAKLVDENTRRLEQRIESQREKKALMTDYTSQKNQAIGSVASTQSSLSARKAADEQARMSADINGASAPATGSAPVSGLRSRLGK